MKTFKTRKLFTISAAAITAAASAILSVSCISCGPVSDLRDFSETDLFPPVIENILPLDEYTIRLDFNEPVLIESIPILEPELDTLSVSPLESSLIINLNNTQTAGKKYVIDATVSDATGNKMSFIFPFYGYNPDIPGLLINEFTTQGSSSHPDIVELLITSDGNPAGLWIVEGTTDYPEQGICLPSFAVKRGDYILIHFKPQGIPEETDEDGDDIAVSGGYDASPTARDFWVPGGSGLSGNNGVIAVYAAPGAGLIDAVLYSNRTTASDEKYSGFGSTRMLDKTIQLAAEEGWNGTGTDGALRPEDAVNPDDSTATRSMCRTSVPSDTDSSADWHIVPTSSSTFGEINIDEVYE